MPTFTPHDFSSPDWSNVKRTHDWKNHVSEEVQAIWPTFTEQQKQALARQAKYLADQEEWD